MKKLTFSAPDQLLDQLSLALFEAGAQGLQEGMGELIAYVSSEAEEHSLRSCALDLTNEHSVEIEVSAEQIDDSWQDAWQNALDAVAVTERWVLRPTHQAPAPDDEATIWFQPQASFGDGSHPTTQLAARAICAWLQLQQSHEKEGVRIVDVGAGNGVLSLIAIKEADRLGLSLQRLLAIDIDEVAVNSMRQNLALNQLEKNAMELRLGTLQRETTVFDLVIANINTPVLVELAARFAENLAPGGTLLLTGLLVEDKTTISAALSETSLTLMETQYQGQWCLMRYQRRPASD